MMTAVRQKESQKPAWMTTHGSKRTIAAIIIAKIDGRAVSLPRNRAIALRAIMKKLRCTRDGEAGEEGIGGGQRQGDEQGRVGGPAGAR